MGERTPPKTDGFWISFRPISMRQEKAPQGIGHESTRAAADVVVTRDWRVYRFERLSNRALAAVGGKCRCGPLGRRFFILGEHSAAARGVGAAAGIEVQAIRCGTFLRRDCNRTKGIPKTMGLWRRSFPHFFRCWKKWVRRRHVTKKRPTLQRPSLSFTLAQYASFSARYAFSSLMGTRTLCPAQRRCAGAPI